MNRFVFVAMGLALLLVLAVGTRSANAQSSGLAIGKYVETMDKQGFLHIIGWLQNNSTLAYQFVEATVTFYDSSGKVVGTASGFADMSFLPAGQKSGFDVVFMQTSQISKIDKVEVAISGDITTATRDAVLQIKQGDGYVDQIGIYHQTGQVMNTGSATATFVKVYALEYSANGTIIGHAFTFTSPSDLQAGQAGTFDITDPDVDGSAIKSVALSSESDQYTMTVPEFPLPMLALLGGIGAVIVAARKMAGKK